MTLNDILSDTREPKDIPTPELAEMLRIIRAAKLWAGPYFKLDAEQQRRAVRAWVKEDVFGHTFSDGKVQS
jgi:hypothetical protein